MILKEIRREESLLDSKEIDCRVDAMAVIINNQITTFSPPLFNIDRQLYLPFMSSTENEFEEKLEVEKVIPYSSIEGDWDL